MSHEFNLTLFYFILFSSFEEIAAVKDRPPRLLPSDRGSLGLAFKSASLSSLLTDF